MAKGKNGKQSPSPQRHQQQSDSEDDSPKTNSPKSPSKKQQSGNGIVRQPDGHITEADFFEFQPHTILGGVALLSILGFVYKYYVADSTDVGHNIKLGIFAAMWAFVVFGMMHFPDGVMVRPHPIVWRGLMALLVIYMMCVIFFLFQDYATTRRIIGMYDPTSLIESDDRTWAEDCRMSTPERPYLWLETIFDEFLLAHLLGYWGKFVVLRDWRLVMFVSFGFEVVEYTFQYAMRNFAECWWDHVIADLIVCNAGGCFLGWLTIKLLKAPEYGFVKLQDVKGVVRKSMRVAQQFRPRSLDRFQWEMFDSFKRFLQVMFLLLAVLFMDFQAFSTKLLWNLEPLHPIVMFRLNVYAWSACAGVREYYEWVSGRSRRIGAMAWLMMFTLTLEGLWVYKMAVQSKHKDFQRPMPAHIALPWIAALALFAVWIVAYFSTKTFRQTRRSAAAWLWRGIVSGLLYAVLAIIAFMCFMATPHTVGVYYQKEFDHWANATKLWEVSSAYVNF